MDEIIDLINEARNAKELHEAGNSMRAFIKDCENKQQRDKILSVWQKKSVRLINPRRVTTNY